MTENRNDSGVLKSAASMGAATLMSRILGLVREEVFAFFFGAGDATDAFNVAFRIPNLLRDLFAEGAMSSALVPTFTRVYKEEGERRAWRIAGLSFRLLFVITSIIAVIGIFFAPELVRLYASGFEQTPGKFNLTVQLTQMMYPFFPAVALAAGFMAVLNARGKFFIPAFAPVLFNATSILVGIFGFFFCLREGFPPIYAMAIGVVIGGIVQASFQLPSLYKVKYRWPGFQAGDLPWYKELALRKILLLMGPGMLALGATQINVLVNTILATSEGTGAVSYLNYAFRLMQFPIGVFGVSLATAMLPRVSGLWVDQDLKGIEKSVTTALNHVFAINLLAAAGLGLLGHAVVQLLFEYGRFKAVDTFATAQVLAAYSIGLVAYSGVKVLVPACYAVGHARLAVISSLISVAFTILFNLIMVRYFSYIGLALGTSLAAFVNFFFLLIVMRRILQKKGGDLPYLPLLKCFVAYTICALVVGIICRWTDQEFLYPLSDRLSLETGHLITALIRAVRVGTLVVEALVLVWIWSKIFRLQEFSSALGIVKRKLIRSKA